VHVLVVAKAPKAGHSKTRLCPPCTPQQAADIAEAALADTLQAVAGCGADRRVLALDGEPGPWLPAGFEVIPQVTGPFDVRLAEAWMAVGGPGLQIGMDTPQVTPELLDQCLATLAPPSVDAVLGLAPDGGWWAIGLRAPQREVFRGIAMSQIDTGVQQRRRLEQLHMTVDLLLELRDIDDMHDARAVAADLPGSRTAAAVGLVSAGDSW
jgi:glycosyltransferase A (GT-A) superfamily protein (DUF2064 family)